MTDSKRQAHSNVVQMVLQTETADAAVEENQNRWLIWSRMVLRFRFATCNLLEGLVAGDGFEPPTFGL
jgi:hypothetical protein